MIEIGKTCFSTIDTPFHTFTHFYTPFHTFTHLYTPLHTFSTIDTPLHTFTHLYTPLHTFTHLYPPLHTFSTIDTPLHTFTHLYTPLHTFTHLYTPLVQLTHLYTPLHTFTHLYTPLHTFSTIDTPFHSSIATVRWMIEATFSAFFVIMPKYLTIISSFDVKSVVNLTAYQTNRKFVFTVSETFSKIFTNRSKQLKHRWFRPCRFDIMYFNVLIKSG